MDNSSPPVKFPIVWGQSATTGYLTHPPATTTTPGAGSYSIGWGPETFLAIASGGTPPLGDYMNGFNNDVTKCLQWIQAGGVFQYDATFQSAIGGYRQGAILANAAGTGFWISTVNNNMTDPDTGGAGWGVLTPNTYPWSSLTGVPSFVLNSAFTGSNQSLATNGYQKLPGGLIQQWCSVGFTAVSGQISSIAFPIAFPSSVFNVQVTILDATLSSGSASNQIIGGVSSISLSGCNVILGENGGGARNITVMVQALGR